MMDSDGKLDNMKILIQGGSGGVGSMAIQVSI